MNMRATGFERSSQVWTNMDSFCAHGLHKSNRNLNLLDAVAARTCGAKVCRKHSCVIKATMKNHYVHIPRPLFQRCFTSKAKGGALCELKTGSDIYSFGHDSMLAGRELMALQGHSKRISTGNASDKTLQTCWFAEEPQFLAWAL